MQRLLILVVVLVAIPCSAVIAVSPSLAGIAADVQGRPVAGIRWHHDFKAGWQEAHRRGLPMVIFISSTRCQYCDAMKSETWCNAAMAKEIDDKFVAIELNPQDNADILKRIKVEMFPMTLIGIPEGKIVGHLSGFQRPENIRTLIRQTLLSR